MKKLLSMITGLVAGSMLYAMPVLNPAAPALLTDGTFACDEGQCWGVKFGYRGDFVFNKHFRDEFRHAGHFNLFANEGVLTINLWDRLDIYGFVGAASIDIDTVATDSIVPAKNDYFIAHYNTTTIGGVGIKAILWETCWGNCGTTYVGLDAQYEWMSPARLNRASIDGASAAVNNSSRKYKEGQVALGISHRINSLVPYVAIKWSQARANIGGSPLGSVVARDSVENIIVAPYRSQRNFGYAFGVSLVDAGRMSVTAEARFIDETALTIAGDIRF